MYTHCMRWLTTTLVYSLSALIGFKAGAGVAPEIQRVIAPGREAPALTNTALPRLGANVVLPEIDVLGRRLPKAGLVVFLGQCSSCSLSAVQPGSIRPLSGSAMVVLYDGVATDASKALARALPPTNQLVYVARLKGVPAFEGVSVPAAVMVEGGRVVRVHTPSAPLFEVAR